jgi:hypothetical protein
MWTSTTGGEGGGGQPKVDKSGHGGEGGSKMDQKVWTSFMDDPSAPGTASSV